jgi:hypothetical protein
MISPAIIPIGSHSNRSIKGERNPSHFDQGRGTATPYESRVNMSKNVYPNNCFDS